MENKHTTPNIKIQIKEVKRLIEIRAYAAAERLLDEADEALKALKNTMKDRQ